MNPGEASEHLAMVDRILATADQRLRLRGTLFILWGLAGAIIDLTFQAVIGREHAVQWWWWLPTILAYLGAITAQVIHVRRYRRLGSLNLAEASFVRLIGVAVIAALVVNLGAGNIFSEWSQAAIWSLCLAIPLLFIGIQGYRAALVGAGILLASIIAANLLPQSAGIALAIGLLIGYSGIGVLFEVQHQRRG